MKKFLPIILFIIGLLVAVGAFVFVRRSSETGDADLDDETTLIEVSLNERPIASLIPSEDGHWLKLKVDKIVIDAASMDYELLYQVSDGRTAGVPGTVKLEGESIERDLLLGSESSGKFRYDEGVDGGTLTLKFRNDKGKLVAKFASDFVLLTNTDTLTSSDGKFAYQMDKEQDDYFVVIETFGVPRDPGGDSVWGPYGVFSSASGKMAGEITWDINVGYFRYNGSEWEDVRNNPSSDIGIFVAVGE